MRLRGERDQGHDMSTSKNGWTNNDVDLDWIALPQARPTRVI
jgi:hypothetical protein